MYLGKVKKINFQSVILLDTLLIFATVCEWLRVYGA